MDMLQAVGLYTIVRVCPEETEASMIERFAVHFEPGMDERVVSVYLPRGYDESDERYPVMYMFDGQNAFESHSDDYDGTWKLHRFLMRWEKGMIVVAVQSSTEADRRMAEYSPYPLEPKRWGSLCARGGQTLGWIADVLKPQIDARYRTLPERACTGVMGGSMGALMSLCAVITRNDVFSKAACVSPAIGECGEAMVKEIAQRALDADTRVYLSLGSDEAKDKPSLSRDVARMLALSNALVRAGVRTYPFVQEGGRHCEADWSRQAPEFMRFLWME